MNKYQFKTDVQASTYFDEIASEMVSIFGIESVEAVGRINQHFDGQSLNSESMIFHELPEFWAKQIYYGPDVDNWWSIDKDIPPGAYDPEQWQQKSG